jgi:hypothetical protein
MFAPRLAISACPNVFKPHNMQWIKNDGTAALRRHDHRSRSEEDEVRMRNGVFVPTRGNQPEGTEFLNALSNDLKIHDVTVLLPKLAVKARTCSGGAAGQSRILSRFFPMNRQHSW